MEKLKNLENISIEFQLKIQAKTFRLNFCSKKGAAIFTIIVLGRLIWGIIRSGVF